MLQVMHTNAFVSDGASDVARRNLARDASHLAGLDACVLARMRHRLARPGAWWRVLDRRSASFASMATKPTKPLHLLAAHEAVALLKNGCVTPLEMIDVVEQRLSQTDCALNTTPITCFDRARAHAARFQVPKTPPRGFLYGLPVLIKDSEAVAGVRFTEGSPIYASRIPDKSSPLVTQLEERGAIVVGKTNVPEFCAGSQSFNPLFPTTVSPWDTRTTAGGSSGGSCSAVAARNAQKSYFCSVTNLVL